MHILDPLFASCLCRLMNAGSVRGSHGHRPRQITEICRLNEYVHKVRHRLGPGWEGVRVGAGVLPSGL